ncbi:hypothetical protein DFH05DRAFT_1457129 [Lentinula detonsa]|uniref:Uncharacterized protein n=1 Tax=Lentinula detonsa TaxID=2804962 RepID=A0A9W8P8U5_9AGAR|nr:hypothetical protein DFH05DRAFT_1457129 [Lentinula detonsa]
MPSSQAARTPVPPTPRILGSDWTPSLPASSQAARSTLQPSVVTNIPYRPSPSHVYTSQSKSHPGSGRVSENQHPQTPEVQHPSMDLLWQPIEVHQNTDARQLRDETLQSSVRAGVAERAESPAVDSSFLHRNAPPSISNRGLTSLLNRSPSLPPLSNSAAPILPPLSPLQLPSQPNRPTVSISNADIRANQQILSEDHTPAPNNSGLTGYENSSSGDGSVSPVPVVAPRMGVGERQVKRRSKDTAFPDAVRALADHTDNEIKRIASEFQKSLLTVKKLMGVHRRFREKKKSSLYNALMHKKAQELRLRGQRLGSNLGDRHKAIADDEDLQDILNDPEGEEAQEALRDLEQYQKARFQGSRASSKANDNDIVKTWGTIANTAQNVSKRTSAATFGFVCSSKAGQNVTRQFFGNGPIEGFLMSKFGMSGAEFVEAAEAYFILTSSGRTATGTSIKKMQKEITRALLEGLRDITKNPNLGMEWEHYEVLIVKEWGVKLEGWPAGVKMATATSLHAADVISVYHAVHSKECKWRKVEGTKLYNLRKEIDARIKKGELMVPERQRRRGKKRANEEQAESLRSKKKPWTGQVKNTGQWKNGAAGSDKTRRKRVARRRAIESDEGDSDGTGEDDGPGTDAVEGVEKEIAKARPKPKPLPRPTKRRVVLSEDEDEDEQETERAQRSRKTVGDGDEDEDDNGNGNEEGNGKGDETGGEEEEEEEDMLIGGIAFDGLDDFGDEEDGDVDQLDEY